MTTKRKVNYYQIEYKNPDDTVGDTSVVLSSVLTHLLSRNVEYRSRNIPCAEKFFFLDSMGMINAKTALLFKSARHSFRPNLIDKDTFEERTNPRRMTEGDVVKTHIVVDTKTFNVVIEASSNGISMKNVVEYLNYYLCDSVSDGAEAGKFILYHIPSDDIDVEAKKLKRATVAELHISKQILGSEALNYSNRTECVSEDIVLQLKPSERGGSILSYVKDVLGGFLNNNPRQIIRIRVKGKDDENNEILLDTLSMSKKTYVLAERNEETGEFNTRSMFETLSALQ